MTQEAIVSVQCEECKHTWFPYGRFQKRVLPFTAIIQCPNCGLEGKMTWYDSETNQKLIQKELGLIDNSINNSLQKENELLKQELDITKKKLDLFEAKLNRIEDWMNERERDFQEIHAYAKEIESENQFREDHK